MDRPQYAFGFRILHWMLFAILAIQFCTVFLFGAFEEHSTGAQRLVFTHMTVGLVILVSGAIFLLSRVTGTQPSNDSLPAWQRKLSKIVQTLLYALLIAQPLLGIAMTMARGHGVPVLGLFEIPQLLPKSKPLGGALGEAHEIVAWVFLGLIAFHALAAIYHYWYLRDDVAQRMSVLRK